MKGKNTEQTITVKGDFRKPKRVIKHTREIDKFCNEKDNICTVYKKVQTRNRK